MFADKRSNRDESESSYIDENLSDVCRALMLDSAIRSINDDQSTHREKPFSETFSFNKEREEQERLVASTRSVPARESPQQSEELEMHEIEYEIFRSKVEPKEMEMELVV